MCCAKCRDSAPRRRKSLPDATEVEGDAEWLRADELGGRGLETLTGARGLKNVQFLDARIQEPDPPDAVTEVGAQLPAPVEAEIARGQHLANPRRGHRRVALGPERGIRRPPRGDVRHEGVPRQAQLRFDLELPRNGESRRRAVPRKTPGTGLLYSEARDFARARGGIADEVVPRSLSLSIPGPLVRLARRRSKA